MKKITVDCTPDGEIKVEAHGFTGNACESATADLEAALGKQTAPRKRKPEYYRQNTNQNRQTLGGGS